MLSFFFKKLFNSEQKPDIVQHNPNVRVVATKTDNPSGDFEYECKLKCYSADKSATLHVTTKQRKEEPLATCPFCGKSFLLISAPKIYRYEAEEGKIDKLSLELESNSHSSRVSKQIRNYYFDETGRKVKVYRDGQFYDYTSPPKKP